MEPPRPPPRPPLRREEPETLPPMRARTPSGHDPVEEIYRQLDLTRAELRRVSAVLEDHRVECARDKTRSESQRQADDAQFRSSRERTEACEASINKLKEAFTTGLLDEARAGKRVAELEKALADEKAERERERRIAIIIHCSVGALFGVVGLIAGAFGLLGHH